jgi:serine/threonine protein kinase
MEAYEWISTIGEGTYGVVLHARHVASSTSVAIKRFKEEERGEGVRKTALREVRILKALKHDNIVQLLEVFRRKRRLYLVFEYMDGTLLEEMERRGEGLTATQVGYAITCVISLSAATRRATNMLCRYAVQCGSCVVHSRICTAAVSYIGILSLRTCCSQHLGC